MPKFQTPSSPESSARPAGEPSGKTWRAGTLTYTTAGLVALFCWLLLGDFAWSMRDRSVGPMAQWYLNHLGVPNLLFGLLISSFPALIGLILGPIISVKSDRHRGKRGRRIPFLLITTPFAALGMIGLGLTPFIAKWLHATFGPEHPTGQAMRASFGASVSGTAIIELLQNEMVVSVICFGIFWAAFEFATIAGQAVFGGLINDVVPKPLLGRFYGLFRAISLIDGMIFNWWIMGSVPTHFTIILLVIGVFYGTAFMWVCFKVREGEYPPPAPYESSRQPGIFSFVGAIRTYCRECFTNSYYILVFLFLMLAGLTFSPVNTFAIPFARSLEVDMDLYGKALALTFFISLILSYFLGWLADLFHPLRTSMAALIGYMAVCVWGSIFAVSSDNFLIAWVLHGVLSGCYFTSAASLGQRLFPHSRYAQFASAAGIFGSLSGIFLAPLIGTFLDSTGKIFRHTFSFGFVLAFLAVITGWIVYRKFLALGGPSRYVAPE